MRVSGKVGGLVGIGAVLACFVAVGVLAISGNDFAVAGLRGTDLLASYGLPVVRVLAEVAAVGCVGGFLFSGFLVPGGDRRAVKVAGWAAVGWAVAALLSVPFTLADVYARSLGYVLEFDRLVELAFAVEPTRAWMLTALVAAVIAVVARTGKHPKVLLVLALFGLVPVASSGHSSSGGDHDWATSSLLIHLVAAALWVGGLVAVLAYRQGEHLTTAVTRFSRLALACWIALAASGVINALVRVKVPNLFTTSYGLLVTAKAIALVALGVFGYLQRVRGVKEVERTASARALVKLGAVEVLLMLATIGLAAALARTPPPDHGEIVPTVELKLGYVLSGPPDALGLLTDWRFDLLLGTGAIVLAVLHRRSLVWLAGCAGILIATSSGIGRYAPAVFSVDMVGTMILGVLSPMLLALATPRKWRLVMHPGAAGVLFAIAFPVVYFTGVLEWSLDQPIAGVGVSLWFLLTGYAFFTSAFAPEIALRARRIMVLAALGTQGTCATILLLHDTVLAERFYRSLRLPWISDLLASQQLGGAIVIGFGVVPLLVTLLVLMVTPQRAKEPEPTASL